MFRRTTREKIRPLRKVRKIDYSPKYEQHSKDIMAYDMNISKGYCDNISALQLYVNGRNKKNFTRFDLDDVQYDFFSQFLVELDDTVFEFEQTEKNQEMFAKLKSKFDKEKENIQQHGSSAFLESFTSNNADNNNLSPFSIFFKYNALVQEREFYWESTTIHSIVSNLFLHALAYEKSIVFGNLEHSSSEALTKRADEWLKQHPKVQDERDLFPFFFLNCCKNFKDQSTLDTFFICEEQRYEFENEDVLLHKDICNQVLYMRCIFINWVERLSNNNYLTRTNLEKIRVFGALVAGPTIAWLEMRLRFCDDQFEIVQGKSIPPFTFSLKMSDIHDVTTVNGLSNSLMLLQNLFTQVKNVVFEACGPSDDKHNIDDGITVDTTDIYNSVIRDCTILEKQPFRQLFIEARNNTQISVELDLEKVLQEKKFQFAEIDYCSVLEMLLDEVPLCLASLNTPIISSTLSMSIYLREGNIAPTIVLFCKQQSTFKLFKLTPTNVACWQQSIKRLLNELPAKKPNNFTKQDKSPILNPYNPLSEYYPTQKLKEKFNQYSLIPSLFKLLGVVKSDVYSINCEAYPYAKVVFLCRAQLHSQYSDGVFIKLTHLCGQDPQIMNYLKTVPQNLKTECNHISQVYDFKEVFLKDNNEDIFFACRELVRKRYGREVCQKLDFDNFESNYSKAFFAIKSPFQIAYLELLQPISIREMLKNMKELKICTPTLKILIITRWIGQCLTILQQLHTKLNILHCDISFDNILSRKSVAVDKIGQLILNQSPLAERFITDLVISDLNTANQLTSPQNNSSDEQRKSVKSPDATKFPYTWHTYEYYGWIQSDNYAMAIFIAKLVRRLLFEDFTEFLDCQNQHSGLTFKDYGKRVIEYFEDMLVKEENNVDLTQQTFLKGLIELLKYIICQDSTQPSLLSKCFQIYQSNILNYCDR